MSFLITRVSRARVTASRGSQTRNKKIYTVYRNKYIFARRSRARGVSEMRHKSSARTGLFNSRVSRSRQRAATLLYSLRLPRFVVKARRGARIYVPL